MITICIAKTKALISCAVTGLQIVGFLMQLLNYLQQAVHVSNFIM